MTARDFSFRNTAKRKLQPFVLFSYIISISYVTNHAYWSALRRCRCYEIFFYPSCLNNKNPFEYNCRYTRVLFYCQRDTLMTLFNSCFKIIRSAMTICSIAEKGRSLWVSLVHKSFKCIISIYFWFFCYIQGCFHI